MAISDYLKVIAEQRDILKESLEAKNVSVDGCTTFNQLTPKVAEIVVDAKLRAQNGVWTPTITSDTFNLSGLMFIPSRLAICCEDILVKNLTSITDHINIAILNIELTSQEIEIIKNGSNTGIKVDTSDISADITIEESNGLYSVTLSFARINEGLAVPYKFKANSSHIWCVSEEGWLI